MTLIEQILSGIFQERKQLCLSITFSTHDYATMRAFVREELSSKADRFDGVIIRHDALLAVGHVIEDYQDHCVIVTPQGRFRGASRNFLKFPVALP